MASRSKISTAADGEHLLAVRDGNLSRSGVPVIAARPRPGSWRCEFYRKLANEIRLTSEQALHAESIEQQREIITNLVSSTQRIILERHPRARFIEGDLNDPLVLMSVKIGELVEYLDDIEALGGRAFDWPILIEGDPLDPRVELMTAFTHLLLLLVRVEGSA